MLPADLYVRIAAAAAAPAASARRNRPRWRALPGAQRVDFLRTRPVSLDPARPDVALMARHIDAADPGRSMVLRRRRWRRCRPARGRPGCRKRCSTCTRSRWAARCRCRSSGRLQPFFVAGVWRDYANQAGSVHIRLADYRALTGDLLVNDVALWTAPGATRRPARSADPRPALRRARWHFAKPGEIRAMSMKIFDRSFAVTYLLEAIAIAIGLAGVAATFSAQTLARAQGVRHAAPRGRHARPGAAASWRWKAASLSALGVACGFALGLLISLILVYRRQPAVLPLDDAAAPAVGPAGQRRRRAAGRVGG